jgi:hypothetical protein
MTNYTNCPLNFEVNNSCFISGYYTMENFGKKNVPTYWLVYEDKDENTTRINNSGLMLTLFTELPANATINAHI